MIEWVIVGIFFSFWLFSKRIKRPMFKIVEGGDIIHTAYGSLLASLSLNGMYFDVTIGILMYLAYQTAGYVRKKDTIDKDIATFAGGYFATVAAKSVLGF